MQTDVGDLRPVGRAVAGDNVDSIATGRPDRRRVRPIALADIGAKVALLASLALVAMDPEWGNLEGKAPVARAITYPSVALVVPLIHLSSRGTKPYPWGADLLISLTGFTDILGNRLDLYDTIEWFDDWMHFMNTAILSGALVAMTTVAGRTCWTDIVLRAMAIGMTVALGWEIFEYVSFVTRSSELPTAYADTVVDLTLGWLGSLLAGSVVAATWWWGGKKHGGRHSPKRVLQSGP